MRRRDSPAAINGGTQRLPGIVGSGNALYSIESGIVIDAQRALRMGLVQEVVPDGQALSRALAPAEQMSKYPRVSLKNDGEAVYERLSLPLAEGIMVEGEIHRGNLTTPIRRRGYVTMPPGSVRRLPVLRMTYRT